MSEAPDWMTPQALPTLKQGKNVLAVVAQFLSDQSGRRPAKQFAKIIDWAGTLRLRKRMQKLIFLLQAAGCPLDADYDFHKYGPYSQDVARLTDELTRVGLLEEEVQRHPFGEHYCYSLSQKTKQQMTDYEESTRGSRTGPTDGPVRRTGPQHVRNRSEGAGGLINHRLLPPARARLGRIHRGNSEIQGTHRAGCLAWSGR